MRCERTFQQRERETRGSSDAQHESRVKEKTMGRQAGITFVGVAD
jgi:hypothetical protein